MLTCSPLLTLLLEFPTSLLDGVCVALLNVVQSRRSVHIPSDVSDKYLFKQTAHATILSHNSSLHALYPLQHPSLPEQRFGDTSLQSLSSHAKYAHTASAVHDPFSYPPHYSSASIFICLQHLQASNKLSLLLYSSHKSFLQLTPADHHPVHSSLQRDVACSNEKDPTVIDQLPASSAGNAPSKTVKSLANTGW